MLLHGEKQKKGKIIGMQCICGGQIQKNIHFPTLIHHGSIDFQKNGSNITGSYIMSFEMKEIDNILKTLTPESNPKASDMTLLDYFAGVAIQHLGTHGIHPDNIGQKCYEIAALMLQERERVKEMQVIEVGDIVRLKSSDMVGKVTGFGEYEGWVKILWQIGFYDDAPISLLEILKKKAVE